MDLTKLISDKIMAGSIAGITGGIIMEITNNILYYLNYLNLRALDFAIILSKRHIAEDLAGIISGLLTHLLFAAITGVVLTYILAYTDHQFYLLKGASIGFGTNFIFWIAASLFDLTKIIEAPITTMLLLYSTAVIHGIITALILTYFHSKLIKV